MIKLEEFKKQTFDGRFNFLAQYAHMFKDRFNIKEWKYNKEINKLMIKWMCIN